MKNRFYKSLLLGVSTAAIATASYALIAPLNESDSSFIDPGIFNDEGNLNLITLNHPNLDLEFTAIEDKKEYQSIEHIIQSGETLSTIFSQHNLSSNDLNQIVRSPQQGNQFTNIKPGKTLKLIQLKNGQLEKLAYQKNPLETIVATRYENGFKIKVSKKTLDKQITSASGHINSSFFLAGKEAGLADKAIMQLTHIFRWDIDFALNIKQGDSFAVVYEKLYADGRLVGTGNILAAEFINNGKTFKAVRFDDHTGKAGYFTPEGKGMRKAFIRTPVDFARISSHFNLKRRHPVLNRIRAHKGVDYAAKKGTPIKVTGDGVITFQGRQSGYGRVVIVQHDKHNSTLYAHMSAFSKNYSKGSLIKQGDIIGYVGQSGLASGPHLHYEFRVDGQHRNPLTANLANSAPIERKQLDQFKKTAEHYLAQLEQAKGHMLAQNTQQ